MSLTIINARILTLAQLGEAAAKPRRGTQMHDLGAIDRGYVRIIDNEITDVGKGDPPPPSSTHTHTSTAPASTSAGGSTSESQQEGEAIIDAGGCVLMPAFVDCHTHACWVGDRFDEYDLLRAGASYLEILKAGGGIMSTVRAVRKASDEELLTALLRRLNAMTALGTGTVEVKSGYGLDTKNELKMLRVIHAATRQTAQLVIGTFLGAHALDPENPHCVEQTINETLPAVAQEFPGITCDAYCEQGAWSLEQCRRLFEEARALDCPIRVHADQFNSLGMTRLAVEMEARSVDHLEAVTPSDLEHLARSETIGVMLPSTGFQLDDRYAPGRALVDAGGALAIASNFNPGSALSPSVPFAVSLASRKLGLSPAEAITAATFNAACVLGLQHDVGSIEVGKRANLQLLDAQDERELAYEFAGPGPLVVICNGEVAHLRAVGREEG